jgi:hypothetical protein
MPPGLLTASVVWPGAWRGPIGIKPGRIYPRSPPDQPSDFPTTKDCSALIPNLSTTAVGDFISAQISSLGCGAAPGGLPLLAPAGRVSFVKLPGLPNAVDSVALRSLRRLRMCSPAEGTIAAVNWQDFGLSRWQLSEKVTPISRVLERGLGAMALLCQPCPLISGPVSDGEPPRLAEWSHNPPGPANRTTKLAGRADRVPRCADARRRDSTAPPMLRRRADPGLQRVWTWWCSPCGKSYRIS